MGEKTRRGKAKQGERDTPIRRDGRKREKVGMGMSAHSMDDMYGTGEEKMGYLGRQERKGGGNMATQWTKVVTYQPGRKSRVFVFRSDSEC